MSNINTTLSHGIQLYISSLICHGLITHCSIVSAKDKRMPNLCIIVYGELPLLQSLLLATL